MISEYIKFHWFLISFSVGVLYIYLISPKKELVFRFPNPNNLLKTVYNDKNHGCYKFKMKKQKCSNLQQNNIKEQPILEDYKNKNIQKYN